MFKILLLPIVLGCYKWKVDLEATRITQEEITDVKFKASGEPVLPTDDFAELADKTLKVTEHIVNLTAGNSGCSWRCQYAIIIGVIAVLQLLI
jgi:hypothetical protein